jgi:hypothetical protein
MGVGLAMIYSLLYVAWQRAGRYLQSTDVTRDLYPW